MFTRQELVTQEELKATFQKAHEKMQGLRTNTNAYDKAVNEKFFALDQLTALAYAQKLADLSEKLNEDDATLLSGVQELIVEDYKLEK